MLRVLGLAVILTLAMAIPAQQAAAQNPLGGAILGGAAGAIIGGAAGGGRGAAIGAGIGAATGAIIASQGEHRRGGYYYWRRGCYIHRPYGWVHVSRRYCYPDDDYYEPRRVYRAPPVYSDAVRYCMQRYRSYDPESGTYLGYDGYRHPCP
jgi:hypothetical protein